jgi:hypothetical protein
MASINQNMTNEPWSMKDQNRIKYAKRTQSELRERCKRTNLYPKSVAWKKAFNKLKRNQMEVIHEKSFEPHFGLEAKDPMMFIINTVVETCGVNKERIMREIEGFVALGFAITRTTDMVGAISTLFLYIRDRFDGSITNEIISYICEHVGYSQQNGFERDTEPEWLKFTRNLRNDWASCISSGLFSTFSKILSLIVIAGITEAASLKFNLLGFKLIEPDMHMLNLKAADIVTAISDIVIFFCERCYYSWKTKSFKPFFANSIESAQLEVEYANLCNQWDMYRNGNLIRMTELSEHDLYRNLESMATRLKSMLPNIHGVDKRIIEDKFRNITKIIGCFNLIKVNSGFKRSPFSIEYYGLSKVGKSTISEQISHYIFTSAKLDTDGGRKYTHVSGKKHWDSARSDMLELKLDDHANTKEKYVESSPCDVIIKVCNNVPYSPPMADLNEKGKVWIQPELVSLTTNVLGLDAHVYSNNPYSIQRRMHYIVNVRVKPEFVEQSDFCKLGIDTKKVIEAHTVDGVYDPPLYHDVWEVDIMRAVPNKSEKISGSYEIVTHNDKLLQNVDMRTACMFLCEKFHQHRDQQFKLESSQQAKKESLRCNHEGCVQLSCFCTEHQQAQFGFERIINYGNRMMNNANTKVDELFNRSRSFYQRFDWLPYVPACIIDSKYGKMAWLYMNKSEIIDEFKMYSVYVWVITFMMIVAGYLFMTSGIRILINNIICLVIACLLQYSLISVVREQYYIKLRYRRSLNDIEVDYTKYMLKIALASSVVLAGLYKLARAIKTWKTMPIQGSLEPKSAEEINQRDNEANVWTSVAKRALPITDYSKRMSNDHVANCVSKALVYGSIHLDHETGMLNGLMLSSNVMLVPDHYFTEFGDDLACTFRKNKPQTSGGKFACRLSKNASYLIPNSDLRVCYVPNGGSFKNLVNMFPVEHMPSVPFRMYWRNKDGEMIVGKGLSKPGVVRTVKSFTGGTYQNLTIDTFNGLCGATLVSETNGSVILGVHLGGHSGTPRGCFGSILQQQLKDAFDGLRKIDGVMLTGDAGNFETVVMGVQVVNDTPLHKKSPLNYMPENSQVEYFGSCPGRAITKTAVCVTPISPLIMDICGVPNIYRGPKLNPDWYGWQTCLANLAVPAVPFPHDLLSLAVRDYKEPLIKIFASKLWKDARPLSDHENLCGIPGKKFMDAIKLDTSIGFPLTGPKRNYVTDLLPEKDKPNNRILDAAVMDEITRIEDCYKRGERGYPIAKACKKDEILTKDKCRIFYGNAISLTYLIRKYYLPLLRVLQMNPLVSECAVGINSHGPEWEQFHTHVLKFGKERIFGGDYGKYDQKLPSQLILAALRILIDCARVCDYSEDDLRVMEAMAGDIVYSYIAYNGDLIGLTEGAQISGNSLTVIINGICGSLNLRCFFYNEYQPKSFDSRYVFRDYVAAMTYGDDNIGSVSPKIDRFTIKGCSHFLAKYGQVYTMPDKESELTDFLPFDEFEFLKRSSIYHPKLGVHLGALLDKSIYKSLHCFMREKNSPLTENQACAQNIDGSLREWFNHGEGKYETQRNLMCSVAEKAGISHMCTELYVTYDERVANWLATHGSK